MGLSEVNRAFIHHMLAAKALTVSDTIKAYNDLLSRVGAKQSRALRDAQMLDGVLTKINKELESSEFQFKTMYSPWEKESYCGLCNTIEDEAIKSAQPPHKQDIQVFFAVIDELREFNGEIKLTDAQNVSVENLSQSVAENGRSINRLNQMGWLKIVRRQNDTASVIFGPRALLELPSIRQFARHYTQEGGHSQGAGQARAEKEEDEDEEEMTQPRRKRRSRRVEEEEDEEMEEQDEVRPSSQARRRGSRQNRLSR